MRDRLIVIGVVVALGLAGCQGISPSPGSMSPGVASASPGQPSTVNSSGETDMRTRLVNALSPSSGAGAMIGEPGTILTEVPLPWLSGWAVVDALNRTLAHPRRYFVALSDSGSAVVLTGQPSAFNDMVRGAATISSDETAVSIATSFVDLTQDFVVASYRVASVDEIRWLSKLNASQETAKEKIIADVKDRLVPAVAQRSGDAWDVTVWTVTGTSLIRHDMAVLADGTVTETTTEVVSDMPVPQSI